MFAVQNDLFDLQTQTTGEPQLTGVMTERTTWDNWRHDYITKYLTWVLVTPAVCFVTCILYYGSSESRNCSTVNFSANKSFS